MYLNLCNVALGKLPARFFMKQERFFRNHFKVILGHIKLVSSFFVLYLLSFPAYA